MYLFDWLSIIQKLKDDGLTHKEIGEKIGWSESKVKDHSALLKNIVENVLVFCKNHQIGRSTNEVETSTFDFTHGWFRNSQLTSSLKIVI